MKEANSNDVMKDNISGNEYVKSNLANKTENPSKEKGVVEMNQSEFDKESTVHRNWLNSACTFTECNCMKFSHAVGNMKEKRKLWK